MSCPLYNGIRRKWNMPFCSIIFINSFKSIFFIHTYVYCYTGFSCQHLTHKLIVFEIDLSIHFGHYRFAVYDYFFPFLSIFFLINGNMNTTHTGHGTVCIIASSHVYRASASTQNVIRKLFCRFSHKIYYFAICIFCSMMDVLSTHDCAVRNS